MGSLKIKEIFSQIWLQNISPRTDKGTDLTCKELRGRRAASMDPIAARAFVEHYYHLFDQNRSQIGDLYRDSSKLTFEGEEVIGAQQIGAKLVDLPFEQCQHAIATFDCQTRCIDYFGSTSSDSILVFVTGNLQMAGQNEALTFTFSQFFQLTQPAEGGVFYVENDMFRFNHSEDGYQSGLEIPATRRDRSGLENTFMGMAYRLFCIRFPSFVDTFVKYYYSTFDLRFRFALVGLYQGFSRLTFEGEYVFGTYDIARKLTNLPFGRCQHVLFSMDHQVYDSDSLFILVCGTIKLQDEDHALKFSQMFHLRQILDYEEEYGWDLQREREREWKRWQRGNFCFYVENDIFRLNFA